MSTSEFMDLVSDHVVGIDQFELGRIVDADWCAKSHDAIDKMTGTKVVVKICDIRIIDPFDREGFMRKIKFQKERHPLIVEFVGCGLIADGTETRFFMAFKPALYVTLDSVLKDEMKGLAADGWDATSKSKCVFGIAAAMCVVHSRNFLHRDLKPSNVQLDEHMEPVLGGFELAREYDPNMTMSVGTPFYMAPEMWSGEEYDNKVDVFSFAVLLHRFFTESMALDDDSHPTSVQDFMRRVGSGARLARVEEIPDFYWDLITRCWDPDPKKRPSFREIVALLHENTEKYIFPDADLSEVKEYESRIISTIPQDQ